MRNLKSCTKEEFDAFVADYPRPLQRDVFGACEPPVLTLNDFTLAPMWPDSVVASYHIGDDPASSVVYYGPPSGFQILAE
jgi:hypothetical protein